jgi:hypothetical protein
MFLTIGLSRFMSVTIDGVLGNWIYSPLTSRKLQKTITMLLISTLYKLAHAKSSQSSVVVSWQRILTQQL